MAFNVKEELPTKKVTKNLQPYIIGLSFFIVMLLIAKIIKDDE